MGFYCINYCDASEKTLHSAWIVSSHGEGKVPALWVWFHRQPDPMEEQLLPEWESNFYQNGRDHALSLQIPNQVAQCLSLPLIVPLALVQLCKLNPFFAPVHATAKLIPVPPQKSAGAPGGQRNGLDGAAFPWQCWLRSGKADHENMF